MLFQVIKGEDRPSSEIREGCLSMWLGDGFSLLWSSSSIQILLHFTHTPDTTPSFYPWFHDRIRRTSIL